MENGILPAAIGVSTSTLVQCPVLRKSTFLLERSITSKGLTCLSFAGNLKPLSGAQSPTVCIESETLVDWIVSKTSGKFSKNSPRPTPSRWDVKPGSGAPFDRVPVGGNTQTELSSTTQGWCTRNFWCCSVTTTKQWQMPLCVPRSSSKDH